MIDFAELGDFVDLKIKNYSSGMLVRLAFSVMIHVDAEILLIDEVLAVGDAAFQQKCFDEFERIRASGATVLFVTHDMGAVKRFCDRALLLEHGRPVALGDPESVGNRYLELNFSEQARQAEAEAAGDAQGEPAEPEPVQSASVDDAERQRPGEPARRREGDGSAEILQAWFEDERGERTETLPVGTRCTLAVSVRFNEQVQSPVFALTLHNSHRDNVLTLEGQPQDSARVDFCGGDVARFRVSFQNVLAPDRYHLTTGVARRAGSWMDRREAMLSIVVTGTHRSGGLIELPFELSVQPDVAVAPAIEVAR